MKILAIIPARSGSKGLKDKNIKSLCGKPLCAYTIEAARNSGIFEEIHFSTDSERYADIAKEYGASVPFLRDAEFASDTASSWDVVRLVLNRYEKIGRKFDAFMLLQPTVPFRSAEDIRNALQLMKEKRANAIVSVTEPEHSPFWCAELPEDGNMTIYHEKMQFMTARQKLPKQYILNGAIYFAGTGYFFSAPDIYSEKAYAYIMPAERSLDIDSQLDFDMCEFIIQMQK